MSGWVANHVGPADTYRRSAGAGTIICRVICHRAAKGCQVSTRRAGTVAMAVVGVEGCRHREGSAWR